MACGYHEGNRRYAGVGQHFTNAILFSRKVFVSFGGLLLYLDGPFKKLTGLRVDYVYLLIKK